MFENIGCIPTIGQVHVCRAVCIRLSPKEASQYLGSLNTCDGHLEEPTVCFISTISGIFSIEEHRITFPQNNEGVSRNTPEAGRSILFRNVGICFQNYTSFHLQRLKSSLFTPPADLFL